METSIEQACFLDVFPAIKGSEVAGKLEFSGFFIEFLEKSFPISDFFLCLKNVVFCIVIDSNDIDSSSLVYSLFHFKY